MPDITVTLTDAQHKALTTVAIPQDWADNALQVRADAAIDEIVASYTTRALDEGVSIPSTRALIVDDAIERGWATVVSSSGSSDTE